MTQPEHDPVERLERLTELHRKGALTDEEFEEQKSVLLRRMIEGGRAVEPDQVSQQGATKTGMDTSEDSGSSSGSPQAEPPPNRAETVVPETGPPDTSRPDDDGLRQGQVLSDTDSGLPRSLETAHAGQTGAAEGRPERGARSRWPWIAGGAGVLVLAAVITTVVLISGGSDEPAAPAAATAASASPPVSSAPELPTYTGSSFSIEYPLGFYRETSEQDMGGYLDTTFRQSGTDTTLVRVNQSPGDALDGRTSALQLEKNTSRTPGYRRISITETTLDGMPAARWEFLTAPSGRTLRTVNILGNDGTSGWAVMTRAPDGDYARWAPTFKQVRSSFTVSKSPGARAPAAQPGDLPSDIGASGENCGLLPGPGAIGVVAKGVPCSEAREIAEQAAWQEDEMSEWNCTGGRTFGRCTGRGTRAGQQVDWFVAD